MEEFKIKNFDTSKSLFIEASAGTGKTYTIQLMVAKMIAEGTPLKKILIVTYTEKAAGELKDRIRKKIDEVLEKGKIDKDMPELSAEQIATFRKAYQDVDNAAIFTIHSFCQKALKEFAYDAGKPFDSSMVDDAAVEDMLDQFIRDKWSSDEKFQELLAGEKDTSALIRSLKKMFIKATDLYKGKDGEDKDIIVLDETEMPQFQSKSLSLEYLEGLAKVKDFEELCKFTEAEAYLSTLEKVAPKEERSANFLTEMKSWKKGKTLFDGKKYRASWLKNVPSEAFNYFKDVKDVVFDIDDKIAKIKLHNFLIAHTPELFNSWLEYKEKNKLQSFNDMILSVHRAVMAGASLISKLRAQYKYAIIDEFQDTNQLQWDIFRRIFLKENDEKDDENVPGHSIFVVGDPKQSIYSFQGADVNVYNKATKEIGNNNPLLHNYRSTDGIIDSCNKLFAGDFFKPAEGMPELVKFSESFPPDSEDQKKTAPEIYGKPARCIWLSEKDVSPESYAAAVVSQIVDWCSKDGDQTKLRVFDKEYGKPGHAEKLRNVTFKDFAILAKSRSEMEEIEADMRLAGIPYTRYKENNLFRSRECAEWIAVFRAINAPDFSSWNRRLLSEVLITDFFKDVVAEKARKSRNSDTSSELEELHYCESKEFDRPDNPERMQIASWRSLALKFRYAEMLEKIYQDTKIEYRLMDVASLQSMARLRQIGNYAIDFLYSHKCSLEDLVRHLEGLARYEESTDDENGDLVEKGSDFNAVQVMTIHASKGLEFPVVISVAGFKRLPNSDPPFIYHEQDGSIHLGFGDSAREKRTREEIEEWKRLFYVDFTRASSILVMPRYDLWYKTDKKTGKVSPSGHFKHVHFLMNSLEKFAKDCRDSYDLLLADDSWTSDNEKWGVLYSNVKTILSQNDTREISLTHDDLERGTTLQKANMAKLQGKVPAASIFQYSYSSLAGRAESPIAEADDGRTDKEGETIPESATETEKESASERQREIDGDVISNVPETIQEDFAESLRMLSPEEECYPRGSKVGDALHNILERARFFKIGEDFKSLDDALGKNPSINTANLTNAIEEEFQAQSLPIAKHRDEWLAITTRFIWNTLNAELPVIEGNRICTTTFKLTSIPETDHKPEVQFGLNADAGCDTPAGDAEAEKILHRMCKGFIDLLFVRTDSEGGKRYSILDWKSDTLDVYTPAKVKAKVDSEYSVQRVLYSYCLIQWLKQFYGKRGDGSGEGLDEQQIFEKHFGGIYYAFLRGTDGKTSSGIYAQTWKDYATLEAAYKRVKQLMTVSVKKGEN